MKTVIDLKNIVKHMDERIVVVLEVDGKQKLMEDYDVTKTDVSGFPVKLLVLKENKDAS